jgi:ribose-phosphate pyrophosphokinase
MLLFALNSTREFGEQIAARLDTKLAAHEERGFEDGEHKARPLVSVRSEDVYVIQSLHGGPDETVNDKLCRLLFFIATLKENGASRVTAVVPYLAYARKDRQTKTRDPVTTKYVARLFEAVGTDCIVTLEVHNLVAFQNAFRCRSIHLDTGRLFAEHIRSLALKGPIVVASPDPGGVKRAQLFREKLERIAGPAGQAFMEKRRSAGVVTGDLLVGEVSGATVLVIDDLIASGGTMARAAKAAREHGAKEVLVLAAHGLFTGNAGKELEAAPVSRIFITDTIPAFRLDPDFVSQHIEIISACPLFAEAIKRLHGGGSISELLGGD